MRGRCPRPLDDSASELHVHRETGHVERSACYFRMVYEPEQAILFTSYFCFSLYLSPFHQSTSPALVARYSPLQLECPTAPQQRVGLRIPSRPQFSVHFSLDKNRIQVTILVRDYCLNSLPPASLLAFLLLGPALPARTAPAAGPK